MTKELTEEVDIGLIIRNLFLIGEGWVMRTPECPSPLYTPSGTATPQQIVWLQCSRCNMAKHSATTRARIDCTLLLPRCGKNHGISISEARRKGTVKQPVTVSISLPNLRPSSQVENGNPEYRTTRFYHVAWKRMENPDTRWGS